MNNASTDHVDNFPHADLVDWITSFDTSPHRAGPDVVRSWAAYRLPHTHGTIIPNRDAAVPVRDAG